MSGPPPLPGYNATAYHPSLREGENKGLLWITGGAAYFRNEDNQQVSIPLAGAEIRKGGPTGDLLQLLHPQHPGAMFWTEDNRLLKDPAILEQPHLAAQIRRFKSRRTCCWGGCLGVILIFVAIVVAFIALRDTIVEIVTDKIPVTWEEKLGEITFAQVKSTTKLIEDPEAVKHLNDLARPLLDAIPPEHKRYKFQLHLAQDDTPNAFAIPGGNIVVHTGLVKEAGRGEELAGVLAHEIAHVTRRHSLQQLVNQAGMLVLLQAVVGDVGGLAGVASDAGHYLLTQKYSRGFERDADQVGWEYLMRANIDPRGMTDFFERLKEEAGNVPDALSILSTHPATSERIEFLEDKEKALPPANYVDLSQPFAALKEKVK